MVKPTLEEAAKLTESVLVEHALKKLFNEQECDLNLNYIKPCLIFLNDQNYSVPVGALVGHLVGSDQECIAEALEFIEVMGEEKQINIRQSNGNWIVDPIGIDYEVDKELGVDIKPIRKTNRDAFCGKLIHRPQASRVDHLQSLNNIKFKLNDEFIKANPNIPDNAPYKKTLPTLLESIEGSIGLDHKYDTRGRTYCSSHINYQGTEYEKCLLKFAKEEQLDVNGIENIFNYRDQLKADEPYLDAVSMQAMEEGISGKTGIFLGVDASASGMQIISVIYGCGKSATNVGILDKSNDAYTLADKKADLDFPPEVDTRKVFKQCCMQHSYGGTKTPIALLGKDNYQKFNDTMWELFPAIQKYIGNIQNIYYRTPVFTWTLPDGFVVQQPVIQTENVTLNFPHYDHVKFGYAYKTLVEKDQGLEMAANVVHSIDGYVARELIFRANQGSEFFTEGLEKKLVKAINLSTDNSKFRKVFSLHRLLSTPSDMWPLLGRDCLRKALNYCVGVSETRMKSFQVISIHDDFKSHPNYMHHMKWLYLEILAELAESTILKDIVEEINPYVSFSYDGTFDKDLGTKIRTARGNGLAKGLT